MICIDSRRSTVSPMFGWCRDSMLKSYFEGKMGTAFADSAEQPAWAAVFSGDFVFVSGRAEGVGELAERVAAMSPETVVIPENVQEWKTALDACGLRLSETVRYHTRLPEAGLDRELLRGMAGQIARFKRGSLRPAGSEEYAELAACEWEKAFVANFKGEQDFLENGFAFCVYIGNELAAAASTFGYYSGGYELQIATKPAHRGQGLAVICAARFLLECLDRGKAPHWDAANKTSLHIAEKCGFLPDGEYTALEKVR